MTYSDKLKSPKWQKKRLEILNRDGFKCKMCGSEDDQLHVHHIIYEDGLDPWGYANNKLITICDFHHKLIHEKDEYQKLAKLPLMEVVNQGFIDVFDFIQSYPWSLKYFRSIENHKGCWIFKFKGSHFFEDRVELLSNLAYFINDMDCQIYLGHSDGKNYFDAIKPIGYINWRIFPLNGFPKTNP